MGKLEYYECVLHYVLSFFLNLNVTCHTEDICLHRHVPHAYVVCAIKWLIVLPVPFLSPVFAELQPANLITLEECQQHYMICRSDIWWLDISDVVGVQGRKSPEVVFQIAGALRRHGFEEESKLLAGRQSRPSSICLCYVVQCNLLMMATL